MKPGSKMKSKTLFLLIISTLLTFYIGCSSTTELISTPAENSIVINGDASDWGANLKYLSDEKVAIGVSNDNHYFYLCLTTNDMSKVMPMFVKGFIVWLENENDKNTLGIRYPLRNIV